MGSPSRAGSSREGSAGIQYSRMSLPIGVPGPTRQTVSLSLLFSIVGSRVSRAIGRRMPPRVGRSDSLYAVGRAAHALGHA
jgi:hypothetical protein